MWINYRLFIPLLLILNVSGWTDAAQLLSDRQKIFTSDGMSSDAFGYSVAVDGRTAIISKHVADSESGREGVVHVFEEDNAGMWIEKGPLIWDQPPFFRGVGSSIAISRSTILVGARADQEMAIEAGAVYVFERDAFGNWNETGKLFASDPAAGAEFGTSVAIDVDRAIISSDGAAYFFRKNNTGAWVESGKVVADDTDRYFGRSVAIYGQTAVIGSPGGGDVGTALVYEEDSTGDWNLTATLVANDSMPHTAFGESVSISGNIIAVGGETPRDPETNLRKSAIHLFELNAAHEWQNVFNFGVEAPTDERADKSVAVSGNVAVLGVPRDDLGFEHRYGLLDYGSAHVFGRRDSSWSKIGSLQPDALLRQQYLGMSVATDGTTVLIGAYGDAGLSLNTGAAYVVNVLPEPTTPVMVCIAACFYVACATRSFRA